GEACGLTDTLSLGCRWRNHSDVMIVTIDALDAWCPPTFRPDGLGRTRFAWWIIAVDSHSTRRSTSLRTAIGAGGAGRSGAVLVMCSPHEMCSMRTEVDQTAHRCAIEHLVIAHYALS